MAMREDEGRPSPGMCPAVMSQTDELLSEQMVVLLVPNEPAESTDYFKFQVQCSHDPNEIRKKGLTLLQSTHYQKARGFSDTMTALFVSQSKLADTLVAKQHCVLNFLQFNQSYSLPCKVQIASKSDPAFDATLWHNRLFNTQLPGDVTVLKFTPDWTKSVSELTS